MHNKKAIEIWQRYSVDNYHYLWLGIKSLFPFYIIEYWITFFDKKEKKFEAKQVAWHKKISFWCHTTSTPSKSQNKIIKLQATYTSKILDVLKYNIVCLLLFLFYSFWEEKVWAIDFLTYACRISSKILIIMLPAFTFLLCFNVQSVSLTL